MSLSFKAQRSLSLAKVEVAFMESLLGEFDRNMIKRLVGSSECKEVAASASAGLSRLEERLMPYTKFNFTIFFKPKEAASAELERIKEECEGVREVELRFLRNLMRDIDSLFEEPILNTKRLVQNTLADASEYNKNLGILERNGELETFNNLDSDKKLVARLRQQLKDSYTYLQSLEQNKFSSQFMLILNVAVNGTRFLGEDDAKKRHDTATLNSYVVAYQNALPPLKAAIITAFKNLFGLYGTIADDCQQLKDLVDKANPLHKFPASDGKSVKKLAGESTTRRADFTAESAKQHGIDDPETVKAKRESYFVKRR